MTFRERARELVSRMTLEEKCSQMQYRSPAIERLGIPAYNWWNEALHGVARAGCATVFPQAIGMAASFDDELLKEAAEAISDEARAKYNEFKTFGGTSWYQGLTYWSPNINIFRDPRWGRGQETYGEDPYLTGRMGAAFIKGLQGEGEYRKLDATIKHYAVHSGPEKLRHEFDARVDDKDLYETYLSAFRYCIENAHPSAVMGAYNRFRGESCCASRKLLEDILRGEFGFDGYVVSDCGAICDIHEHHHITHTPAESAALAVNCGCDLNCGKAYEWLMDAVEQGLVSEDTVTRSAERLFEARFRLGMFDDDCPYNSIGTEVIECEKHTALNLRMAEESMVLLKNDGILPLKKNIRVAVIGPNADSRDVLLGNYNGTPSVYYTLLRGIQEACAGEVLYAEGCGLVRTDEQSGSALLREAVLRAKRADVVVMVMGISPRIEGEEGDAGDSFDNGDRIDIELPAVQKELYEAVLKTGAPIVFVNVSGSCVSLCRQQETANAVLQCFYPGAMGGKALANILFGETAPCGRLPVTFYRGVEDLPPVEDYSMENRTYKFFKGDPLYPFGFGLTYGEVTEKWEDENTVILHNGGAFFVGYTVLKFVNDPHKELKDFRKVPLEPGETRKVIFK
ncbi:MAG: glycoside hydrolase family 3 C-terminal domain-containing protein [Clostridiales bacterium]|nr:glycoside hydrolase family 3 C-terminal domain-containing protein [Clostridiales bacterium]